MVEPLRTWERDGRIKWSPKHGLFVDNNWNENVRGPVYWVTVNLTLSSETITIVRRQPALIPSLAEQRTYNCYAHHFPERCINITLVRRGSTQWDGWRDLARVKGFPTQRSLLPKAENPQLHIES